MMRIREECGVKEQVLMQLAPLFDRAETEGLWFHCNYQDIWLSPAELRVHLAKDEFVWGAVNWELRNPMELLADSEQQMVAIKEQHERLKQRVETWKDWE